MTSWLFEPATPRSNCLTIILDHEPTVTVYPSKEYQFLKKPRLADAEYEKRIFRTGRPTIKNIQSLMRNYLCNFVTNYNCSSETRNDDILKFSNFNTFILSKHCLLDTRKFLLYMYRFTMHNNPSLNFEYLLIVGPTR